VRIAAVIVVDGVGRRDRSVRRDVEPDVEAFDDPAIGGEDCSRERANQKRRDNEESLATSHGAGV
jgi:hypothetical protein